MRQLIFYLSILLYTGSCAGFKNADPVKLDKDILKNINGTYKNIPVMSNGSFVRTVTDVFDRNTNMFNWKEKYTDKNVIVKLQMVRRNRLHVEISESENVLFSKDLRVRLKKDGYLYLKEKRLMIEGIPLVFGGWNIQKSRFAIDSNNNLRVQSNYFYCNGVLVIISYFQMSNYDLTFEKQ